MMNDAALKVATLVLDLQPRCVVGSVYDTDGKLVTEAQGTTYGDTTQKAEAYAFALGYRITYGD